MTDNDAIHCGSLLRIRMYPTAAAPKPEVEPEPEIPEPEVIEPYRPDRDRQDGGDPIEIPEETQDPLA
jgi:hypothetical protein